MGFVIFGNDHDAAGILIQPVHDAGADHPVDARQVLTVKQQRIDQRARIMSRRRMHYHASGFIEHDHIFIFIDDIQRNVFRLRLQRNRPGQYDLKYISRFNFIIRLDQLASFTDAPFVQQNLDMGTGALQHIRKKYISPFPGIGGIRRHRTYIFFHVLRCKVRLLSGIIPDNGSSRSLCFIQFSRNPFCSMPHKISPTPTHMAISATLNTGQIRKSKKSMTSPV